MEDFDFDRVRMCHGKWRTPRLHAYVWRCGDEHCNCHHAKVELIGPGSRYPFKKIETIWDGLYYSAGMGGLEEGEAEAIESEIADAMEKYKIPFEKGDNDLFPHGEREISEEEAERIRSEPRISLSAEQFKKWLVRDIRGGLTRGP